MADGDTGVACKGREMAVYMTSLDRAARLALTVSGDKWAMAMLALPDGPVSEVCMAADPAVAAALRDLAAHVGRDDVELPAPGAPALSCAGIASWRGVRRAMRHAAGDGHVTVATADSAPRTHDAEVMRGLGHIADLLADACASPVAAGAADPADGALPFRELFESAPALFLVLEPRRFHIVAVSNAYLQATMVERGHVLGRPIFDVFPAGPMERDGEGAAALKASLEQVRRTGKADLMALQRYPIRRPSAQDDGFEERYWSPINAPVLDAAGDVAFIIHRVEDVTSYVAGHRPGQALSARDMVRLEAEIVARAPALERPAEAACDTMRVLLIDDEATMVDHVRGILERAGFAFHAAHSARVGLELARTVQPDVILIDKVWPDLDGIALLRLMRRDESLSTVPVIMLSVRADEAARVAALGEGADDFVPKPFTAKDLVARIEANVRLVRLRRDAVWRQGELVRLRQSQQQLRTLLDTVQRVRDDERRMLAREVHDQLGQLLTAAKIDIRLLQRRIADPAQPPAREQIAAELDSALTGVDRAIAAVQDIAALLRPPALEQGGLVAALRWQADDLRRRTGIECVVRHEPEGYVEQPPFVAGELLRMCQEALTNVLRHACATRILIQVVVRNACLLVRICDDGAGIARVKLHDPASLGLKGMRERAASINASVHVYGRRGRGTMVTIRRRLAFL
jgi:signal transduction histidine kinase